MTSELSANFADLGLSQPLLEAIQALGYETPSPIQAQAIPLITEGGDLIGQAQTGTGKTAAFALPIIDKIDISLNAPQAVVIAPTRELALQVAEAFDQYAQHLRGFRVLPVYGGQPFHQQIKSLKRGVHVIVGTPGRIMDHMRRGNLVWDNLKTLVLDEADEMLRMGFIEDVEWILSHTPDSRQIALFSATMPSQIKKVAKTFLKDPEHVQIKSKTRTATTIEQCFLTVSNTHKTDALTRVLETEDFDAAIVFVRTKGATTEVAGKLRARGYAAEAINGDIVQKTREKMVSQLKDGELDVLVATDVAARGLDVERISLVINYDIPQDPESYVHRIGRTGRAGRSGKAVLFVTPRENRLLRSIEKVTASKVERMKLPSIEIVNNERIKKFYDRINEQLAVEEVNPYLEMIENFQAEHDIPGNQIAAAIAQMMYAEKPLLLEEDRRIEAEFSSRDRGDREERGGRGERRERRRSGPEKVLDLEARPLKGHSDIPSERFVLRVGRDHGVSPTHIVGAIANEAQMDSQYIGSIEIYDQITTVDLPEGMPNEVLVHLGQARVCGRKLLMERAKDFDPQSVESDSGDGDYRDDYKPRGDAKRRGDGKGRGDKHRKKFNEAQKRRGKGGSKEGGRFGKGKPSKDSNKRSR